MKIVWNPSSPTREVNTRNLTQEQKTLLNEVAVASWDEDVSGSPTLPNILNVLIESDETSRLELATALYEKNKAVVCYA